MKHRRDDAARLELLVKPEPVEHFQGGGMIGAGARHLFEEIIVAQRLDEANFLVGLRQRQRQAQADGAGADDDDAIGIGGQLRLRRHFLGGAGPAVMGQVEHHAVGIAIFCLVE